MRIVRYHEYGDPDVLRVDEVDRPAPEKDEVLVEMRAASVNPVDTMFRSGEYGRELGEFPAIPGGDGAGVVREVGRDVDSFAAGDRVFASGMGHAEGGTTAEYVAFPAIKLARLPDAVGFEAGAAAGNVGATAWVALEEIAELRAGDRVLVHGGAGGVGHLAVQLADAAGAEVVATAGSETARDRVRELGADAVFDYDSDSLAEDVRAATGGVEVVLDHMAEEYLEVDLDVVAQGGQIVTIMGDLPAASGFPLRQKEVTVRGMSLGNRAERTPILRRLARLMERGELTPVVAGSYGFDEIAQAHRDVLAGGYVGKLVVTP
jgi:NADPH2:quinone reductase